MRDTVTIIGGGMAGVEVARVLSAAGIRSRLCEMRPVRTTEAHTSDKLAEVVCSNSLGSRSLTTGKGVLLAEMEALGSLVVSAAKHAAVPAGNSLALDRDQFAAEVTGRVEALPGVEVVRDEVTELPAEGPVVVATGPLTSPALSQSLAAATGAEHLFFYDAIAPIVSEESLDRSVVFEATRYGKGDPDFLNIPLDEEQYFAFVDALLAGEVVPTKDFEQAAHFEGCMPIEELASRGRKTLAFGAMRPVGLDDPRTGRRPYAVVQLRKEDKAGQLYNLVGFQTKLRYGEQTRVFRMLPGLAEAEFVRLGSLHRNTFIKSPALLTPDLSLGARDDVWFAGQITGVEGYAESAATGILVGLAIAARLRGDAYAPPPELSMLGALMSWMRHADPAHFQPMNVNFGLLPALDNPPRAKKEKRTLLGERAVAAMQAWIAERGYDWVTEAPVATA